MPNLIDHLVFRARLEPASIAVQTSELGLTHLQLLMWVRAVASRLRQAGVRPGQLVVTSLRARHIDWVFTLALAHEAALSCSEVGNLDLPAPLKWDWVITDGEAAGIDAHRVIRIDDIWLKAASDEYKPVEPINGPAAAPLRLFLTSGTTGAKKAVAMNYAQLVGRARLSGAVRTPALTISMVGSSTQAGFNAYVMCLLSGATIYAMDSGKQAGALIHRFRLECVIGSPAQIGGVVKYLEQHDMKLDSLKLVRLAGAAPSRTLVALIRKRMAPDILVHYGSTEAGGMCMWRPDGEFDTAMAGYPLPDAQVQVVDDSDMPLATGQAGVIRVKTAQMVDGYYMDPGQSSKSFRGGWFYPGDRGFLTAGGSLMLAGREAERINVGGVKIDPLALDQFLLDYPGIDDAAAFETEDERGSPRLAMAIVGKDVDLDVLKTAMRGKFGDVSTPGIVVYLDAIPRNAMGKVVRRQLGAMAAAALAKRPAKA